MSTKPKRPASDATDGSFEQHQIETAVEFMELAEDALREAVLDADSHNLTKRLSAYSDLSKHLCAARERWLVVLERQKRLVDLDEVMEAIGPELSETRRLLSSFGKRLAPEMDCSPAERARRLDTEIDRVLRSLSGAKASAEKCFTIDDITLDGAEGDPS